MTDKLKNIVLHIVMLAFVFQLHAAVVVCHKPNTQAAFKPAVHNHCDHESMPANDVRITHSDNHDCAPCTDVPVNLIAKHQSNSLRRVLIDILPVYSIQNDLKPAITTRVDADHISQPLHNITTVILLI